MEIYAAQAYAAEGKQALHVFRPQAYIRPDSPDCFRRAKLAAHLFDQNIGRLRTTAEWLGVRRVKVEKEGKPGQHVDLCGKPLRKAIEYCAEVQEKAESQSELSL